MATPLDAERARLRADGHTEAEISQILVMRAVGAQAQQSAGAAPVQGNMQGVLGNAAAVLSHAKGAIPVLQADLANLSSSTAPAKSRAKSFVVLAFAAVIAGVLGFVLYQEYQIHIVAAPITAAAQAQKAAAEAGVASDLQAAELKLKHAQVVAMTANPNDSIGEAARRSKDSLEYRAVVRDVKQASAEHDAGHYDEAYQWALKATAEAEAFDKETRAGKLGVLTAAALNELSQDSLFVRKFGDSLGYAERAISVEPVKFGFAPEAYHAAALMFLGRTAEAKAIYLDFKGQQVSGHSWEQMIHDQFAELRTAGLTHPLMAEVEAALPIPIATATTPEPTPTKDAKAQYEKEMRLWEVCLAAAKLNNQSPSTCNR